MHHSFPQGPMKPYWKSLDLMLSSTDLQINRTDGNFQKFNFNISSDLNYLQLLNVKMYTQSNKRNVSWRINDETDYTTFVNNANNSRIFQTNEITLGLQSHDLISFFTNPQKSIFVNQNVSLSILGIPVTVQNIFQ